MYKVICFLPKKLESKHLFEKWLQRAQNIPRFLRGCAHIKKPMLTLARGASGHLVTGGGSAASRHTVCCVRAPCESLVYRPRRSREELPLAPFALILLLFLLSPPIWWLFTLLFFQPTVFQWRRFCPPLSTQGDLWQCPESFWASSPTGEEGLLASSGLTAGRHRTSIRSEESSQLKILIMLGSIAHSFAQQILLWFVQRGG